MKVGLIGRNGSGKTRALNVLELMGYKILDSNYMDFGRNSEEQYKLAKELSQDKGDLAIATHSIDGIAGLTGFKLICLDSNKIYNSNNCKYVSIIQNKFFGVEEEEA